MERAFNFDAPGKGTWEMDAVHCPRPLSGLLLDMFAPALSGGMRDACERYGLLLDTLDVRYVHGFPYVQPRGLGAPEGAKPPPRWVFKLATWLHPALRRRLRTASTVFERRPWLEELADWDTRVRSETVAAHRALWAQDPSSMSDEQLGAHITKVLDHAIRMGTQDHSYNLTYMIPLGDFIVHAQRWTETSVVDLLKLFRGSSDISGGDSDERKRLVRAIREDATALAIVRDVEDPAEVLRRLAGCPGSVGSATEEFLVIFGNGPSHGLDITIATAAEEPSSLVAALRRSVEAVDRETNGVKSLLASVRGQVAQEHLSMFDELYADAKLVYRLRDERHLYGALPTCGIARRAVLEVGRRLVGRGDLPRPELALHARCEELKAMLAEAPTIDELELERRAEAREQLHARDIPLVLGGEPAPPPPSDWMPAGGARRMTEALGVFFAHSEHAFSEKPTATAIDGLAVSSGTVEGTARVCEDTVDLARIEPGDILVASTTTPAINLVLPLLGGIVTDRGGALCHAAIVTREFGIPGVVGTRVATQRIGEGARIRVDGNSGRVTVLA